MGVLASGVRLAVNIVDLEPNAVEAEDVLGMAVVDNTRGTSESIHACMQKRIRIIASYMY